MGFEAGSAEGVRADDAVDGFSEAEEGGVDPACAEVWAAGVGGGEGGVWCGGRVGVEGDGPAVEEEGFVGGFPAGAEGGEEPEFD